MHTTHGQMAAYRILQWGLGHYHPLFRQATESVLFTGEVDIVAYRCYATTCQQRDDLLAGAQETLYRCIKRFLPGWAGLEVYRNHPQETIVVVRLTQPVHVGVLGVTIAQNAAPGLHSPQTTFNFPERGVGHWLAQRFGWLETQRQALEAAGLAGAFGEAQVQWLEANGEQELALQLRRCPFAQVSH